MAPQNLGNETTSIVADGAEMTMERVFDAPRELVWKAFTEREHIARWWGPTDTTTEVVEMDVRPGGSWRYVVRDADGQVSPFTGEYLEVAPPEKLAYTFIYDVEPFDADAVVETVTFESLDGRTRVHTHSRFPSVEALEGMVATGMAAGAIETYDRLERLLTDLADGAGR